jgi:hypothetical protein
MTNLTFLIEIYLVLRKLLNKRVVKEKNYVPLKSMENISIIWLKKIDQKTITCIQFIHLFK